MSKPWSLTLYIQTREEKQKEVESVQAQLSESSAQLKSANEEISELKSRVDQVSKEISEKLQAEHKKKVEEVETR